MGKLIGIVWLVLAGLTVVLWLVMLIARPFVGTAGAWAACRTGLLWLTGIVFIPALFIIFLLSALTKRG